MVEPTKRSVQTLGIGMDDLLSARDQLAIEPDHEDSDASRLRAGIGVMRRFYKAFFAEVYDTDIEGFGWEGKTDAVAAILAKEDEESGDEHLTSARLNVATLFEDLVDVLHGEVDFGYTDEIEVIRDFVEEYLDLWAETVFKWLDGAEAPEAAQLRMQYNEWHS